MGFDPFEFWSFRLSCAATILVPCVCHLVCLLEGVRGASQVMTFELRTVKATNAQGLVNLFVSLVFVCLYCLVVVLSAPHWGPSRHRYFARGWIKRRRYSTLYIRLIAVIMCNVELC